MSFRTALPAAAPQEYVDAAAHSDALHRAGRHVEAVAFLAKLVRELEQQTDLVPAWPYSRLALLHRHLREYAEEVDVLERYQRLDPDGERRSRFAARLSKARALAERPGVRDRALKLRS